MSIGVVQEDVTTLEVDAIQNAANGLLRHGAGVAGAIAKAGGPTLVAESNATIAETGMLDEGAAAWTTGGDMKAKYVIHAVTMRFPGQRTNKQVVQLATQNTLYVAEALHVESLALVALGTGIGGLDLRECALGMMEVIRVLPRVGVEKITFVVHDNEAEKVFRQALAETFA